MEQTKGWTLYFLAGGRVRHLVPRDDVIWHDKAPDCDCKPIMEWLRGEGNVRIGRFYIHEARDGRPD
jgi:hypothetical protein